MAYTIGYVYRAGTYCNGECITEALIAEGRLAPAARDLRTEDNLTMLAEVEALDALEMADTDAFPQAVDSRPDDLMGQACEVCHGEIDPAPAYMGRNRAGAWVERCGCGSTEHRDDAPAAFHLPA